MKKSAQKTAFIVMFAIMICLPAIIHVFGFYKQEDMNSEKRELAERPELTVDSYENFSKDYETYLNDHLPFRNELILLNSRINYYVFDKASDNRVIKGKDGWLFYSTHDYDDPIEHYQGTNLLSEEELQKISQNLLGIEADLREKGIEFVIFIAPNKERVYSDMMPDYYGKPSETYMAKQVIEYLEENTELRVVYPYEELMAAREMLPDANLYYKVDTHWNFLGGYVGATELLEELGIILPDIASEQVTISEIENENYDLASMMNMVSDLKDDECDYEVSGYDDNSVKTIKWDFYNEIIYESVDADPRKLFVVRDSYGSAIAEYLGSQFNESYMIKNYAYKGEQLSEQNPDIFVLETVERYVVNLGTFDLEKGPQN